MVKTQGQIAYETEKQDFPFYHDGAPRRTWDQISDIARASWERNPTPRALGCKKRNIKTAFSGA